MATRDVLQASILARGVVQADPASKVCKWLRARPVRIVLMPGNKPP
jgi:hypothetical protein